MARIKIVDLPEDRKISRDDMKRVSGGVTYAMFPGVDGEASDDKHKGWIDISFVSPVLKK